jgi:hypothetical protein
VRYPSICRWTHWSRPGLICAIALREAAFGAGAMSLYNVLAAPDVPKSMRLAAMHSIISTEVSPTRPR